MSNPTMKSGFRSKLQIKALGGGIGTLTDLRTAEDELLEIAAGLATKTLEQSALESQIATLATANANLTEQIDYYQAIIDNPSSEAEEISEAEARQAEVEAEDTANDDLIADLTTEKDAVDVEVTTLEGDLTTAEATRDGLIATAGVGVYETVPLVEELTFPAVMAEYDTLLPIDGSTNGFPSTIPTETFENDEIEWTMGINKENAIHDRLEQAAMNHDLIATRMIATDGRVYSFNMRMMEFRRMAESKKANRAKCKATLDGPITIA